MKKDWKKWCKFIKKPDSKVHTVKDLIEDNQWTYIIWEDGVDYGYIWEKDKILIEEECLHQELFNVDETIIEKIEIKIQELQEEHKNILRNTNKEIEILQTRSETQIDQIEGQIGFLESLLESNK